MRIDSSWTQLRNVLQSISGWFALFLAEASLVVKTRAALQLENVALGHQIAVLQRSANKRPQLHAADRLLWVWVSRVWAGWRSSLMIVKPVVSQSISPVLGVEESPPYGSSSHGSRGPRVNSSNGHCESALGCTADSWELQKLGISVSQATVAKYMSRRDKPPSQPWRTFLASHVGQIMAADFFVVPTVTYRWLFVLVILAHDRRRIVHVAVTDHPTAAWTAQQLRNGFPEDHAPRYLLHDRDTVFTDVASTIGAMQILRSSRHRGRTPTSNASSARSDASAWIT